jgi:CNT family concentrative nucleoside transporter
MKVLIVGSWWIVGLVYHRHDYNWVEPMLLWILITIRLATFYVPAHYALLYVQAC